MLIFSVVVALAFCCLTFASDPSPLQDFCVADSSSQGTMLMNGFTCKNPATVQASDFSFSGLQNPGNTANAVGSVVTAATVAQIPGLNTLGISMVRVDYAPWVIEGTLEVGFVTSNPENRLISKILHKGDVFVFPIGLVHFQRNIGHGNAVAIAALSSQNPGVITIANSVFGSKPDIATDILAKAFQVDKSIVQKLQWNF
ncbi:Putative germin-like protein 2-1 [Linum perenne]